MQDFLVQWFDATPLDRLATAFVFVDFAEAGARAMGAYDRWVGLMSDENIRAELRDVQYDTRDSSQAFAELRELGRQFEDALGSLLFSSRLGPVTRAYGVL